VRDARPGGGGRPREVAQRDVTRCGRDVARDANRQRARFRPDERGKLLARGARKIDAARGEPGGRSKDGLPGRRVHADVGRRCGYRPLAAGRGDLGGGQRGAIGANEG